MQIILLAIVLAKQLAIWRNIGKLIFDNGYSTIFLRDSLLADTIDAILLILSIFRKLNRILYV